MSKKKIGFVNTNAIEDAINASIDTLEKSLQELKTVNEEKYNELLNVINERLLIVDPHDDETFDVGNDVEIKYLDALQLLGLASIYKHNAKRLKQCANDEIASVQIDNIVFANKATMPQLIEDNNNINNTIQKI